MPLYLLALTDQPVPRFEVHQRTFRSVQCAPGIYAVYERRTQAPPASDDELRSQHQVMVRLGERSRAILPARFGTLMDADELKGSVREFEAQIVAGLEAVRGKVQMTLRIVGRRPSSEASRAPVVEPTLSGRDYLERRRMASQLTMPRRVESMLRRLQPFLAQERREPGSGPLLATVYHLVNRRDVRHYRATVEDSTLPGLLLTGPWPPFAFTPRLF